MRSSLQLVAKGFEGLQCLGGVCFRCLSPCRQTPGFSIVKMAEAWKEMKIERRNNNKANLLTGVLCLGSFLVVVHPRSADSGCGFPGSLALGFSRACSAWVVFVSDVGPMPAESGCSINRYRWKPGKKSKLRGESKSKAKLFKLAYCL